MIEVKRPKIEDGWYEILKMNLNHHISETLKYS